MFVCFVNSLAREKMTKSPDLMVTPLTGHIIYMKTKRYAVQEKCVFLSDFIVSRRRCGRVKVVSVVLVDD